MVLTHTRDYLSITNLIFNALSVLIGTENMLSKHYYKHWCSPFPVNPYLVSNEWTQMFCIVFQTSLISLTLATTIKHVLFLRRGSRKPQYLLCVPLFAPLKQLIGNNAFPQLITSAFSTLRLCVGSDLFDSRLWESEVIRVNFKVMPFLFGQQWLAYLC